MDLRGDLTGSRIHSSEDTGAILDPGFPLWPVSPVPQFRHLSWENAARLVQVFLRGSEMYLPAVS